MPQLPILVFAESHEDPITGVLLKKLTPKLKSLGYSSFLDENGDKLSAYGLIDTLERAENAYRKLSERFDQYGLCITDKNHIEIFILQCLIDQGINDHTLLLILLSNFLVDISETIARYPANVTFKAFLHTLIENKITYKGIDIDPELITSHASLLALNTHRDNKMADAYLESTEAAFARTGLLHALGMQQRILSKIDYEKASAQFCFFNIHSQPALTQCDNLEGRVRAGEISYPLGIISIDATTHTEDELVEMIMVNIATRKEQLEKSSPSNVTTLSAHLESKPKMESYYDLQKEANYLESEEKIKFGTYTQILGNKANLTHDRRSISDKSKNQTNSLFSFCAFNTSENNNSPIAMNRGEMTRNDLKGVTQDTYTSKIRP